MKNSVIIPCYLIPDIGGELLDFTRTCVESMRKFFPTSTELVIVDNGSTIGEAYLRAIADVYIRNDKNLGFAPAVNQGLKSAHGDWLIVSNNDVEFLHDWATDVQEKWIPEVGVVSSHLHDHDRDHKAGFQMAAVGTMFGALWMMPRPVYEKVGGFDEAYKIGMWEDRDLWQRVNQAGYALAKCGWCNHVGNATWGKMENQEQIFESNKRLYVEKWLKQV